MLKGQEVTVILPMIISTANLKKKSPFKCW